MMPDFEQLGSGWRTLGFWPRLVLFLALGAALLAFRGEPKTVPTLSEELLAEVTRAKARVADERAEKESERSEDSTPPGECVPAEVSASFSWLEQHLERYGASRRAVTKSVKMTKRSLDWEPKTSREWEGPGAINNDAYKAERQEAHLRLMFSLAADVGRHGRNGDVPECVAADFRSLGVEMRQITKDLEEAMVAEHQKQAKRGSGLGSEIKASLLQNSQEAQRILNRLRTQSLEAGRMP